MMSEAPPSGLIRSDWNNSFLAHPSIRSGQIAGGFTFAAEMLSLARGYIVSVWQTLSLCPDCNYTQKNKRKMASDSGPLSKTCENGMRNPRGDPPRCSTVLMNVDKGPTSAGGTPLK